MQQAVTKETWMDRFEGFDRLEAPTRALLKERSRIVHYPKGTEIFGPGKPADSMLLLLDGTIRIQKIGESGREIVLYRVHGGESCVLTSACVLAHGDYAAEAIADTDVDAVAIPKRVFDDLIGRSELFRQFIFEAYSRRIADLIGVIDDIAFQRMDIRLGQKLLEMSDTTGTVKATHQQLAHELGTAREVVSRLLQEFERRGWISRSRGEIALLAPASLENMRDGAALHA